MPTRIVALAIAGRNCRGAHRSVRDPLCGNASHSSVLDQNEQIVMFSARPSSYRAATDTNYLYGDRSARIGRPERRLFPGVLPLLLAVVGLLLYAPANHALMYLIGLATAFEMSLGLKGYTFRFLYQHVPAFDGLRAPARLGIFVVFFLALLAAYGQTALQKGSGHTHAARAHRRHPGGATSGVWVAPLPLTPYPRVAATLSVAEDATGRRRGGIPHAAADQLARP